MSDVLGLEGEGVHVWDEAGAEGALPSPLTTFVGREDQMRQVAELLDTRRLVTLTGSGGCGKTRLALEVARGVQAASGRAVAFVDLAPLDSPFLVAHAVASALGVPESASLALEDVLFRSLRERAVLVVLDNCERVVEECAPLVHGLLSRCESVTVLATSREPLGVAGEVTFRVPSLTLPPTDLRDCRAALELSEAGRLFLDRANLARPGYGPSEEEAAAMASICRSLDGIPLAIELTASRLRALDASQLVDGLADRFELLRGGPRTAPPRQRTLEASIAWSYDLLDEAERKLFRRLAVFASSFRAEAAAEVAKADDLSKTESLVVLGALVDRSLVQMEESPTGSRYRLLETVREYARRRLAEAGEAATFRTRHLDYHLALARQLKPILKRGVEVESTLQVIESALDNFRTAMDWSIGSGQVGKGFRLATALQYFWVGRSRIREGRSRLTELLAVDTDADLSERAGALVAASQLSLYATDPISQRDLATEALELAGSSGDRVAEGEALTMLGWATTFLDPPSARPVLARALATLRGAGDEHFAGIGHNGMATALANEGDLRGAAEAATNALAAGRSGSAWGMRFSLGVLGYIRTLQGRLEEAVTDLRQVKEGPADAYDRFYQDLAAQWLGLVRTMQGAYDEAAAIHEQALVRTEAAGNPPMLGWHHSAILELAVNHPDRAADLAGRALAVFQLMGWRWFEAQALTVLGDAAALMGDHVTAASRWQEAMASADASRNPLAHAVAALGVSRAAAQQGDVAHARALARSALRAALGADYRLGAVDALEALAVLAAGDAGRDEDARDAALLLGAVEGERCRIGYARFPIARPGFEGASSAVRSALGAEFDQAWQEGSRLPLEEASAMAARGDRRPPRPPSGWRSLTPTEERVAGLVAEGLTNPQIGERLFVSRRTVQTHLSHIFTKLGVSSRAELAAEVSRRQQT